MRIAVTGSNGLVGSRLCAQLGAQGHQLLGLSRGPSIPGAPERYASLDLAEAAAVDRAVEAFMPEAIIHTASMTEVDACEAHRPLAFAANVQAAANVALAARRVGAHLVHVSTDYVFDGNAGPYTEEAVPNPLGVYATTKYAGELAVRTLAGSWTIARTAVVYGWPAASRQNFGAWLVGALSRGEPVRLFVDQVVSPSLADNVAQMLGELAERKLEGIFNVCGAEAVDRVTFGRLVCERFGFDQELLVPVKMAEANLQSPRPARSGLVAEKARRLLNSGPLSLDQSLARFHAAWKSHHDAAATADRSVA